MLELNRIKFFLSLNGKTSQKKTYKNSTSHILDANHKLGFNAYRLAPKLLKHHQDTKYIRN